MSEDHNARVTRNPLTQRAKDLWVAFKSDQPTIEKYRSIRTDRKLLEHLIYD